MLRRRPTVLACWICLGTAALAFALVSARSTLARADWPPDESKGPVDYSDSKNWPADPGFGGMWEVWSFLPPSVQNNPKTTDQNKRIGAGAHVDRAWAKTIGDRRVLISELDSGIEWEADDLLNKWHLNAGELPAPDDGCPVGGHSQEPHDANGDGIFNVQDYTTVSGHAVPFFDKVCDKRVKAKGDVNQNGYLDPEDLIATFSDGTDADGNGYVDDISGWDFFHNDNDPFDDTRYGHGTGESKGSSAEGNNGRGDIGTCPECSIQMLRVGDSFVTDSNNFAMAVIYAVDSGSSVVQEALGTITNTGFSKQAMDYAYANNVAIVASAADEDSFHHNYPGTNNHTFYVHSITFDSNDWHNATTFLNYCNCTNYGAQLVASVPGASCSSEATEKAAGMMGLLYSAALQSNLPLPDGGAGKGDVNSIRRITAEEAYQLMKMNVDDMYDAKDATDPTKYETRVGWEQRFGYGRVNARSAVDALLGGKLPPEVELIDPEWFQVLYPERTPKVTMKGRVQVNHAQKGDTFDWVLEYGTGVEVDDAKWTEIAKGTMVAASTPMVGALADWDISGIKVDNPTQGAPDGLTNRRLVTVRLRATIHSMDAKREGTKGEMRRALFIERDPDLLPGWPVHIGSSGEANGKMADLLGDGKQELVIADSNGYVHAFKIDGTELAGWPVRTGLIPGLNPNAPHPNPHNTAAAFAKNGISPDQHSATAFSSAVGDIDGDKKPEVIIATLDGWVYAWHGDGKLVTGWPFMIDHDTQTQTDPRHVLQEGVQAAPALADMDKDGKLDVIVATMNALVYVLGGDGKPLASWNGGKPLLVQDPSLNEKTDPQIIRDRIVSSPALGDLNGDGVPEIVLGTNEDYDNNARLYAIDGAAAKFMPGWPIAIVSNYILPYVGGGMPNAPAMADLNGDKVPEIMVGGIGSALRTYDKNGKVFGRIYSNSLSDYGPMTNAQNAVSVVLIANPSVGDLDDDGVLDVVQPTAGGDAATAFATGGLRRDFEHHLSAWDTQTAKYKPGFPQTIEDWQFFNNPTIADIDGDGHTEVLEGSAGYWVHAFRADGTEPAGFPKLTGGWITQSIVLGDMDGDGKLEFAVGTRDGWLYAWKGGGKTTGRVDWPSFHHDNYNTGNYDTALPFGSKAAPVTAQPDLGTGTGPTTKTGCSCDVGARTPGPAAASLFGLVLMGLVLRRRRN